MAETFETFIASERERLNKEREAIFNQQHELEGKLAAINNEMRAIDAYEAAKSGKAASTRQTGTRRVPQRRSGSKREELLRVITEGNGLARGEILVDRPGPGRGWMVPQGEQGRRDVRIERAHRAHQGEPGAAGRG